MKARTTRLFAVSAALVLLFAPAATAQVITGSIVGTVSDETGAVLPGVEVTVQNQDTGFSRTVITDDRGAYRAISLPVGPYEIRSELAGFQTTVRSGIGLTVGAQAVVDVSLRVGEITEQVFVTGEASLVETTQSSVADLVDERKIRDLPLNGRDFAQLAMLQAGVVNSISAPRSQIGNEGAKISISGTRSTQSAILLDGTDIRNELNTGSGSASGALLGVETVREYQVITGVFSAEYGRFTGGVINAVTKSGTNEFHGNVYEFHRNSALDARNFFDQEEVPPFKRNQYGFTLGGPIVPDKTFFFGAFEGLRERLFESQVASVPGPDMLAGKLPLREVTDCAASGGTVEGNLCNLGIPAALQPYFALYPPANTGVTRRDGTADHIFPGNFPTNEDYYMVKVDHQFSDSDSFFVRWTLDEGDRQVPIRFPIFGQDAIYRNQWTTLEWKRIINPALINEARFGLTRSRHDVLPTFEAPTSLLFVPPDQVSWEPTFGELIIEGLTTLGPSHNQFKTNVYNNFQFTDNMIYTRGRHALKFGFNLQRMQFNYVNLARASGIYNFESLEDAFLVQPRSFDTFVEHTSRIGVRQSVIGIYIQDDFSATPNLTINAGLRWEGITVPKEVGNPGRIGNMDTPLDPAIREGDPYFDNPSLKNFSPRIGLAWDPFGNGKTSVRAGFGVFFDQIVSSYWGSQIQQTLPNFRAVIQKPQFFPNDFINLPDLSDTPSGPWLLFNPEQPYLMQWSLNLQRELFPSGVLLVGYSGSRGVHLSRFVNANTSFGVRRADGSLSFNGENRNPNFGDMRATVWDAYSNYHALRTTFNKRYSNRYQFQVSYSFSKLIDSGGGTGFFDRGSSGDALFMTTIDDVDFDRGPSSFNIAHTFNANYTVDLPGDNLGGAAGKILGGWQVGGIVTATSGEQMTILITFDRAGMAAGTLRVQRPDFIPGIDPFVGDLPTGYMNPFAFAVPKRGYLGNLGRGTIVGPERYTADLSLVKKVQWGDDASQTVQFRAEFFNLLNRANFRNPSTRVIVSPRGRNSCSRPGADLKTCGVRSRRFGRTTRTVTTS
ncbi:TonB-dependent receptor, partial [Acidobacteria bacterium AH-259-D05]|nr:TonB-dependent receptor [Acidobacteria bacterium AH-259-D05]